MKKKKKVALGMSGGVDSSLCAHLLKEQGYDVIGVYLECWRAPGCRSEEDRKDALKVALNLGIPFKVLDFKQAYKNKVVEYFFENYKKGLTPNPDVMCNKEIKFGLFYDWAMKENFDYIATGHYAKIIELTKNKSSSKETKKNNKLNKIKSIKQLAIPKDTHKDQTYFLYLLTENQIDHTIFPLQNFKKTQVRKEAEIRKIHVCNKKDSVGICFIGDIDVHKFLKDRLGENPGNVVDTAGNIIGSHKGLWFYTIGQRSGFTINTKTVIKQDDGTTISKHNIPPFYVISKNPKNNQLVVGFGSETLSNSFKVRELHWITKSNQDIASNLFVRIRHTGQLLKCKLKIDSNNKIATVLLKNPTKGIAEGQSAVFYLEIGNNSDYTTPNHTTKELTAHITATQNKTSNKLSAKLTAKLNKEIICLGGGIITKY